MPSCTIASFPSLATHPGSDLHGDASLGNLVVRMSARVTRLGAGLTVFVFLVALLVPLVTWCVNGVPKAGRLPEERSAHARPPWPRTLEQLSTFSRDVEHWFGDALGGRTTLLSWRSREFVAGFGVSPTPIAYTGKDAWVFLAASREFDMQRGAAPLGRFEIEAWVSAIRARQAFCREHGAEYVFAVAPDKTSIYPERHAYALEAFGPSRTDQLQAQLAGDPVFLDLRASLLAAKSADRADDHAYFPYGSHWTDRGAAAGIRALGDHVRAWPKLESWARLDESDLTYATHGIEGDTWAHRLYLSGYLEQSERIVESMRGPSFDLHFDSDGIVDTRGVSTSSDASLPRVVMFHDSFGQAAVKFVAKTASRAVTIWDFFQPAVVIEERPDLVIELYVERVLARPPVENLAAQGAFGRTLFDAARPHFVMDLARDEHHLASKGGIETRHVDGAIGIRWLKPTALAVLPAEVSPDSRRAIVRLEVEVEIATDVNFHYKTKQNPEYGRTNAIAQMLPAGKSEVFLYLAAPDIRGPLVFRTNRASELKLHSCESRLLD